MKAFPVLFSSLFLLPLVGFWMSIMIGHPVPDPLGNSRLAKFPGTEQATLSSGWLRQTASWLNERSPFRYRTMQIRNRVFTTFARGLYPIPVNPGNREVCSGKDGWLFLLDETPLERSKHDLEIIAHRAVILGRMVQSSGRAFYFASLPDKASIYPEYTGLVKNWAERHSNRAGLRSILAEAFEEEPELRSSYVEIWKPMLRAKAEGDPLLYWEKDTHWNYRGMVVFARALINGIQPGLFEEDSVKVEGLEYRIYDLSAAFLLQGDATGTPRYVIHRTGGEPEIIGTKSKSHLQRVIKGHTVLIHDSFAGGAFQMLAPWFEDLVLVHQDTFGSPEMVSQLAASDTVIWTSVERALQFRLRIWAGTNNEFVEAALAKKKP